jgi:hypothetical protein
MVRQNIMTERILGSQEAHLMANSRKRHGRKKLGTRSISQKNIPWDTLPSVWPPQPQFPPLLSSPFNYESIRPHLLTLYWGHPIF